MGNYYVKSAMKVKIFILPKKAVVDPQGIVVKDCLNRMGYTGIKSVHIGKYFEIDMEGNKEIIVSQIDKACHKFLSNPLIEDYRIEIE